MSIKFKVSQTKVLTEAKAMNSADWGRYSASKVHESDLTEVFEGDANRLSKYLDYEMMAKDSEISVAISTVCDFTVSRSNLPQDSASKVFILHASKDLTKNETAVLMEVLRTWERMNKMRTRIWDMVYGLYVYGDVFMIRDPKSMKLHPINPAEIQSIKVERNRTRSITEYVMTNKSFGLDVLLSSTSLVTSDQMSSLNYIHIASMGQGGAVKRGTSQQAVDNNTGYFDVPAEHVVHISSSGRSYDQWPFGTSYLDSVLLDFKKREILEESAMVYRLTRAPERRVFNIDCGDMPQKQAFAYTQRIMNSVQQKRIPMKDSNGKFDVVGSRMNPMNMAEDFFFPVTEGGRGSTVTQLPGASNLNDLDDLLRLDKKVRAGLGVPESYLPGGEEKAQNSDGNRTTALIEDFRFNEMCKRLQDTIMGILDLEFKFFVKKQGYSFDLSAFSLGLPEPQSFAEYKQIDINQQRIASYTQISENPEISKQFAMKKYLGLTAEEMAENERLIAEERGLILKDDNEDEEHAQAENGMKVKSASEEELGYAGSGAKNEGESTVDSLENEVSMENDV